MSRTAVIVSAARTPMGRFLGGLSSLSAAELGVAAVSEALKRAGVDAARLGEVIIGNARQAGGGPNVGRQIAVRSGVPVEVPAYTVNMACASGIKTIALGAASILSGEADLVVAGGTESMSRVPYLLDRARTGYRMGNAALVDGMYRDGFLCPLAEQVMGDTAENLVERYGISREEQDRFALDSQRKAGAAIAEGRFDREIVPIDVPAARGRVETVSRDEHPRPDSSLEKLAKLKAVFREPGSVTAGNSSGIVDGAAALVLAQESVARETGLPVRARILGWAAAGVEPRVMGIGVVPAVEKLLAATGLRLEEFDLVEINEAFAAQVLSVLREIPLERERLNVNGGAVALGHPIGATGSRIVVTLLHEMERREARLGMAALCVSGGLGMAIAIERAA